MDNSIENIDSEQKNYENERIEAVKEFAKKLDTFLNENIKDAAPGLLIYKESCFRAVGLPEEMKTTHFIPVYHGLFYVGLFGASKEGWSTVAK